MMWLLFSLKGRIGRKSWWLTNLAVMVASIFIIGGFVSVMGMDLMVVDPTTQMPTGQIDFVGAAPLIAIYLALIWIGIALSVKRLHDNDMRGWWYLMVIVPVIGGLALLIICGFIKGDEDANRFGEPVV